MEHLFLKQGTSLKRNMGGMLKRKKIIILMWKDLLTSSCYSMGNSWIVGKLNYKKKD
jgi:hypothetical protein